MADMDRPFPHADRKDLPNPPIELIIAQVRFPTLAALFSNDGYVPFAEAIAGEFPSAEPVRRVEYELSPSGIAEKAQNPVWKFDDLDGQTTLTLTPTFLALETKQYQSFSQFRDTFISSCDKLASCHTVRYRTRLGLRYVDRVTREKYANLPVDWITLINSPALPLSAQAGGLPHQSELETRFQVSDCLGLTYRSTMSLEGFGTTESTDFTLDLDAFDPTKAEIASLADRLDDLKELSHNAFWWTLGNLFEAIGQQIG